jgi:TldD protein
MKKNFFQRTIFVSVFLQLLSCYSIVSAQDKLATILQDEVNREFSVLKKQQVPVYYISYRVDDVNGYGATAQFGSLINSDSYKSRVLTINLRVGTPTLDNSHPVRDSQGSFGYGRIELPAEDNADAVKNIVWKATNDAYLDAVSKFSKVKANVTVKVDEEDKAADFTIGTPVVYEESPIKIESLKFDVKEWEKRLKKYSAEFLKDSAIFSGNSGLDMKVTRKYFISTNGDKIIQNLSSTNLSVAGNIKAKDGMELPLYKSFAAFRPDGLPSDKEMMKLTEELVQNLVALKNAPVAEPFSGPALLSATASGVFFHEIFGHRVEGQRMKNENDAQTFKKKVGEVILPKMLSVYCDPLQKTYHGIELNGYYQYDDEGTKAERVNIVENGVLKNFLMSRSPIKGFANSNGHGRAQAGMQPVSRQSNLVIETSERKTTADLRAELIRLTKEQKLQYGYLFQEVTGGFTTTGRFMPSAFNVMPTLVYRVYVDGRPDEIVRGVDLIGTPLAMFSQIDMAGGEKGVFNGTCGAESGGVPVSCCSPMFLVKMIETQKKGKSQERPYILPRPTENN